MEEVERIRTAAGAHARPVREIVALLTEGPQSLVGLIRASAVSRRGVQAVLDAARDDLVEDVSGVRLRPDAVAAYRERFGYVQLRRTAAGDPLAARLAEHAGLVAEVAELVAGAPEPRSALDHVPATPETVVRRALWLDSTFDLAGAHLLFVGDHDLTALAVTRLNPDAAATVVDLDERLLSYLDDQAPERRSRIRCLYADLRFGLPAAAYGCADVAFTDPPYTPDGVRLFVDAGLLGLRDRELGRVVLAYGFGEAHPTLGLKVQQALSARQVVFESILPDFNRYAGGGQAVGGASDLYVCRPTSRTWRAVETSGGGGGGGAGAGPANIYTHGPQSLEGEDSGADLAALAALSVAAAGPDSLSVAAAVMRAPGPGVEWAASSLRLSTVVGSGLPAAVTRRRRFAVAADLTGDPGPWLLRILLAANADRIALLVPNQHPDLTSEAAQHDLIALIGPKYDLRFRRNTPDSRTTVVEATTRRRATTPHGQLVRHLLDRAHGKIGNVWRDGLVAATRDEAAPALTRNQARARVEAAAADADGDTDLDATLMELPRHQLAGVFAAAAASADMPEPGPEQAA